MTRRLGSGPLAVLRFFPLAALAALSGVLGACAPGDDAVGSDEANQTAWKAPAEGSCEAKALLEAANTTSLEDLDGPAGLDRRAAESVVAGRPVATVAALDALAYVGPSALAALTRWADARGLTAACKDGGAPVGGELGVISDLDETVIPEAKVDLSLPPFPGVRTLYRLLEHRGGGQAGDVYYVTARVPEKVVDVPAYLAQHGVPGGPIETGTSGVPWIAEPEKVKDCSSILDATGAQRFVLLGDSSHRDPEVYKKVVAKYPGRIVAAFIHKVTTTVEPSRVEGLVLHESYAEVAATLYGLGELTRAEAEEVVRDARAEGLAISEADAKALLDAHAP